MRRKGFVPDVDHRGLNRVVPLPVPTVAAVVKRLTLVLSFSVELPAEHDRHGMAVRVISIFDSRGPARGVFEIDTAPVAPRDEQPVTAVGIGYHVLGKC